MGQRGLLSSSRPVIQGGTGLKAVPPESLLLGNGSNEFSLVALPPTGHQLHFGGGSWVTKAEGKVLQVLTFTSSATHNVSSGSIPIWTFSLTLKKSNSKVLLILAMPAARDSPTNGWGVYLLTRVTTTPAHNAIVYRYGYPFTFYPLAAPSALWLPTVDGLWLDSPGVAAGGVVSYTISLENTSNTGNLVNNWGGANVSTALLMEIGV